MQNYTYKTYFKAFRPATLQPDEQTRSDAIDRFRDIF